MVEVVATNEQKKVYLICDTLQRRNLSARDKEDEPIHGYKSKTHGHMFRKKH